jgi:hypothetical protein
MMRNDKTPVFMSVEIKREITMYDVACLLSSGMEGGINYWARIVDFKEPAKLDVTLDKLSAMIYEHMRDEATHHVYKHIDYVLNAGGEVHIQVTEDHNTCHPKYLKVEAGGTVPEGYTHIDDGSGPEWYKRERHDWEWDENDEFLICPVCKARARTVILTHDSLRKGLEIMRDKVPNQFEAIGTGRADACTGDVFIQCCVFGELVFG